MKKRGGMGDAQNGILRTIRAKALQDSASNSSAPKAQEFLEGGVGGDFLQKVSLPQIHFAKTAGVLFGKLLELRGCFCYVFLSVTTT
jgi:hypothetical protein